jgi:hypothetical protein
MESSWNGIGFQKDVISESVFIFFSGAILSSILVNCVVHFNALRMFLRYQNGRGKGI